MPTDEDPPSVRDGAERVLRQDGALRISFLTSFQLEGPQTADLPGERGICYSMWHGRPHGIHLFRGDEGCLCLGRTARCINVSNENGSALVRPLQGRVLDIVGARNDTNPVVQGSKPGTVVVRRLGFARQCP
jgi:hypothetical protein